MLEEAARRAREGHLTTRVQWLNAPAADHLATTEVAYDRALCVGASHAFGGYIPMLEAIGNRMEKGGILLIGEGFWKKPPSTEYSTTEYA